MMESSFRGTSVTKKFLPVLLIYEIVTSSKHPQGACTLLYTDHSGFVKFQMMVIRFAVCTYRMHKGM